MKRDLDFILPSIDERERIYISLREMLGTWEENAKLFSEGQTVRGIIRSIESYGIFIELTPNLAGLAEIREGVEVGQTAAVYIKNIIPERMKIKLVMIDSSFAETKITEPKYFGADAAHIDRWQYSPNRSQRKIVTEF